MQKIMDEIKEIIQEVSGLEIDEMDSDANLFSLGLDSLMLVQIKKKVDHEFQVDLPVGRIMSDVDTIEKVAHFIKGDWDVQEEEKKRFCEESEEIGETALQDESSEGIVQTREQHVDYSFMGKERNQPFGEGIQKQNINCKMREEQDRIQNRQSGTGIQEILEMQMKMMAQSMQELAKIQLETVHGSFGTTESDSGTRTDNSQKREAVSDKQREGADCRRVPKKQIPQINFRAVKLDQDKFTEEQKTFLSDFIARYNKRTKRSKEYAMSHRRNFCDWITTLNFRMDFKELIYPIVSAKSQGSKFWDIDGNQYLDMAIGYGVHYFGHRPQFIVEALEQQIAEGYETGPQTDLGGEVAELLCQITGNERVAFANTGSEAVMAALRIARTVTKKSKVVMFKGAYHGNFDCVLAESEAGETFPISPGMMPGMVEDVLVLEYASEESIAVIKEHAHEVAAVIVEPVQSRNPSLQPGEFLMELRQLTTEIGAALIFDEMITGFRICPGGCQEYFGIQADLATYGKIVGGGLPIGIVAGKAEYLDAVDGGMWEYGDKSYPKKEMTYFAGTFCKHPLSLAAARAVLRFIAKDEGETQRKVNALTTYFVEKVNSYFIQENVPLKVSSFGSEFRFESNGRYALSMLPAEIELFFYLLMEKGVYIWEKRTCFFSVAHTYDDADYFLEKIKESIEEMRAGGFEFAAKADSQHVTLATRQTEKVYP